MLHSFMNVVLLLFVVVKICEPKIFMSVCLLCFMWFLVYFVLGFTYIILYLCLLFLYFYVFQSIVEKLKSKKCEKWLLCAGDGRLV